MSFPSTELRAIVGFSVFPGEAVPSVGVVLPVVCRHLFCATLLSAAVLVLAACGDDGSTDDAAGSTMPEEPAAVPVALLDAEAGGASDESELLVDVLDGQPAVVNLFASWCAPCIEEMPDFEAVHQDVGHQVGFIGLAIDDTDVRALEIVDSTGVTYPTYIDVDGDAISYFQATGMPTTAFLDADGTVLDVRSRPLSESQLRSTIEDLF